jgi:chromosome partitioning protein
MAKIIAMANHKGGVGKTTSVASIGICLSLKGYKVLLLDLDAQANLTSFFLPETEEERATIYDSLIQGEPIPIQEVAKNLYLVPSGLEMARAEGDLNGRLARERVLSLLLKPVKDEYDYILIDCPPSLGIVTTNAFVASTDIYIPLTAEALPLKGMKMLEEYIEAISVIRDDIRITGVFITRYNNRNLNSVVDSQIKKLYEGVVFDTKIRENISLAEVPLCGGNIYEYAPTSNGANDYKNLTEEIIARNK